MLQQGKRHFVEAGFRTDYLWNTLFGSRLMALDQCCGWWTALFPTSFFTMRHAQSNGKEFTMQPNKETGTARHGIRTPTHCVTSCMLTL